MPHGRGWRVHAVRRDEMQLRLQLQWRWQPASLLQLLQRPVWLDAWVHGEEERASFLWRGLPNHVILHILKLRTIEKWTTKFDCVLKLRLKRRAINKWKWKTLLLRALPPEDATAPSSKGAARQRSKASGHFLVFFFASS